MSSCHLGQSILVAVPCLYQQHEGFERHYRHNKCYDGSGEVIQLGLAEHVHELDPAVAEHVLDSVVAEHVHELPPVVDGHVHELDHDLVVTEHVVAGGEHVIAGVEHVLAGVEHVLAGVEHVDVGEHVLAGGELVLAGCEPVLAVEVVVLPLFCL